MAEDCLAVMRALGHERFMVAGHDRGGRVAYRLALDHPQAVRALVPIDIVPTAEQWRRMGAEGAIKSYHWAFLAQPHPMPETLIAGAPVHYLEHTLASWTRTRDLSPFSAKAMAHYRALLQAPASVHAVCEDYRAGATIDRRLDEADLAAGRRIACPTFVLWASDYLNTKAGTPLEVWRPWCTELTGAAVLSGHFLAEENPNDTLAASISVENCSTRSLTGSSTWPGAKVTPTPAGCTATSVPCATEITAFNARAVANVTSARFRLAASLTSVTSWVAGSRAGAPTTVGAGAHSVGSRKAAPACGQSASPGPSTPMPASPTRSTSAGITQLRTPGRHCCRRSRTHCSPPP